MSGVEVLGLISAITAIIDATLKVYNAARDAKGLPDEFRVVAERLPLVKSTLLVAENGVENNPDQESTTAMKQLLKGCKGRARSLEKIFEAVIPSSSATKLQRLWAAMATLGKRKDVETLMKDIITDIELMASNHTLTATTRSRVVEIIHKKSPSKQEEPAPSNTISNKGSGMQNLHLGRGDQNVNTGSGPQFNRGTFKGSVNLYTPGQQDGVQD
ncbi:hypothetical protein V8F33_004865 [Rhypophila sp. PSN 637]